MLQNRGRLAVFGMAAAIFIAAGTLAGSANAAGGGFASSSSGNANSAQYERGVQAVNKGEFERAVPLLKDALKQDENNADVLNYLGFANRKLGKFDLALNYYERALEADPEHKGAREYLGELYLELGDVDNAERQLQALDDLCFFSCKEYDDLKKRIAEYKAAPSSS